MIVKEAVFSRYKRLYVSGITKIEYKPENKIQIILGTNGSGKSSLLKELIPNVNNIKDEYDNNGYKYIKYDHNGNIIELNYDKSTNKHSFKINGEELNTAGLVSIQKQLIDQYFNIRKEVSELLLSTINFTTMSVNERKKWFTEILSNIDYSYALSLFNKAKQRNRELAAYIKLTKSKMLEYSKKLEELNEKNVDDIKTSLNILNDVLANLLEQKQPYKEIDIDKLRHNLLSYIESGRKIINELKIKNLTKTKINNKLAILKSELDDLTKKKDDVLEKINKLEQLKVSENDDKNSLIKRINELKDKLVKIEEINVYNLPLDNINDVYIEYKSILPYLTEYHSELIDLNLDTESYLSDLDRYSNKVTTLKQGISELSLKINLIEEHVNKHNKDDEVTCPKCGHSFVPGMDNIDKLVKERNEYVNKLNILKNEYKSIKDKYDKLLRYKKIVDNIRSMLDNELLNNIYTYISNKTNKFNNVYNLQTILDKILLDLEHMVKYDACKSELKELEYKLNIMDRVGDDKLNKIFERLNDLRDEYASIITKLNNLNQEYDRFNNYKRDVDELNKIFNVVERYVKSIKEIKQNLIIKEQNKILNDVIFKVKNKITELESELNELKNIQKHHNSLKDELESFDKRYKATTKLVELLSPNKGIIARSIISLINDVLERMNNIINRVWSYEINILPCNIDENDLTYRFPVKINNDKIIDDVSKGSSSIREIIDLAFKIVAMEYLNMLDYPLILDEFGRTMDPVHRIKAYDLVEELSMNYFSQIYLVSHYESMYGRFVNADVVILDESNIEYNGEYNKVVNITRGQ